MQALPYVLGIGGSILKGIGGSKPQSSTSSSTTNSSSSTTAQLTGRQHKLMKQLFEALSGQLSGGPNVMQSDRNQARGQINQTYNAMAPRLQANMTARGFGNSGRVGSGLRDIEYQRGNAIQSNEADLRREALGRWTQMLGMSQQFIQPHNFSTTGTSSTRGTQTVPGQSPFGQLGGGAMDLGSILQLRNLLGSGGGAGSGGYSNPYDLIDNGPS